jgi:RND family efflux transporter MFP subunit
MRPTGSPIRLPCARSLGLILVACLSAAGCGNSASQARPAGARRDSVPIQTTTVQRVTIPRSVELAGTLLSPEQARVSSEAPGVIREVLVELGTEVRPGDPLVRLDDRESRLALERAESALRQTEAQLGIPAMAAPPPDEAISAVKTAAATRDDARMNLARVEKLVSRQLLAPVELDNAQTKLKLAESAYAAALDNARSLKASLQDRRAAYELAQKKAADAVIRAPVGGSVSERLVQPGEFIRENTPVATIVQLSPLRLRTAVQERHAAAIAPGLPVTFRVESFPGVDFEGRVAHVSPAVDQATRTFAVEALVENKDRRLKPGFFAKGVIQTRVDRDVPAVPDSAVSTLAGVSNVYVVEQGKVRQQQVTLGARVGSLVEVVDGLKGSEVLAASNLGQLATGTSVSTGQGGDGGPVNGPDKGERPAGAEPRPQGRAQ